METKIHELYASTLRPLPARERLQLAALILEDLARTVDALDVSDSWSEQDQHDLSAFALSRVATTYSDKDDDLVMTREM